MDIDKDELEAVDQMAALLAPHGRVSRAHILALLVAKNIINALPSDAWDAAASNHIDAVDTILRDLKVARLRAIVWDGGGEKKDRTPERPAFRSPPQKNDF